MEKGEKFLPIGSVVLLNGGKKRVMITGYCVGSAKNRNRLWDYSGCLFPEGVISSNQTALFDHNQIADVSFLGCADDEEEKFVTKLKEYMSRPDKIVLMNDYQLSHPEVANKQQNPTSNNTTPETITTTNENPIAQGSPATPNVVDIPQTAVPHVDIPAFDDHPHVDLPPQQ